MTKTIRPGARFGRLVVVIPFGRVRKADGTAKRDPAALCICDCGKLTAPARHNLTGGSIQSCGCEKVDALAERCTKHGGSKTAEYKIWQLMRDRCANPNNPAFADYGGRGIQVAPELEDFPRFLAEVGPRPTSKHSIDRIDNTKNYEPGNIRWATAPTQSRNRRSNILVELNGEILCMLDAARALGLPFDRVRMRRRLGKPFAEWFAPHTGLRLVQDGTRAVEVAGDGALDLS